MTGAGSSSGRVMANPPSTSRVDSGHQETDLVLIGVLTAAGLSAMSLIAWIWVPQPTFTASPLGRVEGYDPYGSLAAAISVGTWVLALVCGAVACIHLMRTWGRQPSSRGQPRVSRVLWVLVASVLMAASSLAQAWTFVHAIN